MDINILMDASGSMGENEKESILHYLVSAVEGYLKCYSEGGSCSLYQWGDSIVRLEIMEEFCIQDVSCKGNIAEFIKEHHGEKFLLITDGCFSGKVKKGLKGLTEKEDIFCVGVGCDCDFQALQSLLGSSRTFKAWDIVTCLRNMEAEEG